MIEYFLLSIYILFISLLKFRNTKLQLSLCLIPFFIFIATRVGWTADYYSYEEMFDEQHHWTWSDYLYNSYNKFEPGFFLLLKYLPSYRAVLFVTSLFYSFAIFFVFNKYIPKGFFFLAFILWLFNATFFESFAAVRSSVVIAFFIFAVHYKLSGKLLISIVLIVISGFFHRSGFILLPLLLIPTEFIKKHFILTCWSLFIILGIIIFAPDIITRTINNYLSDSTFEHYTTYIGNTNVGLGYVILMSFRILFIIYFLWLIKGGVIKGDYLWFVVLIFLSYIIASLPDIQIGYRFNAYLNPLIIFLQIYVVSKDKSILSKLYIALTIFLMLFSFSSFFEHPNYIPFFLNYKSSLFI